MTPAGWWHDAVVYQVYPRSFQDADGDGEGDLRGITARLDHLEWLGADALWLSPIYPSPMADGGYDVADYTDVDPRFGTLADADALVAAAHARGLRVLLDVVPCHTSIEHPWFREHPERYVWSPADGPANNWCAQFGGPAWSRDPHGRGWYLHTFYPEQPDLDWHRDDVRAAMGDVLRFWLARGVDGFRLDALDHLVKDAALRDDAPAAAPFPFPLPAAVARLARDRSANAAGTDEALATLRAAAGDALLVGEVFLPTAGLGPYLEHLDAAFCFELFFSTWEADALARAIAAGIAVGPVAWVLGNHDFPRLATRLGAEHARAAALLLLTLPGAVFVYQGDEIGLPDGPGGDPPRDRFGRDPQRHPMPWDATPAGGFTGGEPWLPVAPAPLGSVAEQRGDPDSVLALYRDLITLRRAAIVGPLEELRADDGVLSFRRGGHVVVLNTAPEPRPVPGDGTVVRATHVAAMPAGEPAPHLLPVGHGYVAVL